MTRVGKTFEGRKRCGWIINEHPLNDFNSLNANKIIILFIASRLIVHSLVDLREGNHFAQRMMNHLMLWCSVDRIEACEHIGIGLKCGSGFVWCSFLNMRRCQTFSRGFLCFGEVTAPFDRFFSGSDFGQNKTPTKSNKQRLADPQRKWIKAIKIRRSDGLDCFILVLFSVRW